MVLRRYAIIEGNYLDYAISTAACGWNFSPVPVFAPRKTPAPVCFPVSSSTWVLLSVEPLALQGLSNEGRCGRGAIRLSRRGRGHGLRVQARELV
jgi:hypothetical protein